MGAGGKDLARDLEIGQAAALGGGEGDEVARALVVMTADWAHVLGRAKGQHKASKDGPAADSGLPPDPG